MEKNPIDLTQFYQGEREREREREKERGRESGKWYKGREKKEYSDYIKCGKN